jgi:hypothetical protein
MPSSMQRIVRRVASVIKQRTWNRIELMTVPRVRLKIGQRVVERQADSARGLLFTQWRHLE